MPKIRVLEEFKDWSPKSSKLFGSQQSTANIADRAGALVAVKPDWPDQLERYRKATEHQHGSSGLRVQGESGSFPNTQHAIECFTGKAHHRRLALTGQRQDPEDSDDCSPFILTVKVRACFACARQQTRSKMANHPKPFPSSAVSGHPQGVNPQNHDGQLQIQSVNTLAQNQFESQASST